MDHFAKDIVIEPSSEFWVASWGADYIKAVQISEWDEQTAVSELLDELKHKLSEKDFEIDVLEAVDELLATYEIGLNGMTVPRLADTERVELQQIVQFLAENKQTQSSLGTIGRALDCKPHEVFAALF